MPLTDLVGGKILGPKLVAAIEFGTNISRYAYQRREDFERNPRKIEIAKWNRRAGVSLKTPSAILFDEDMNFYSFGEEAEQKYDELTQNDKHWDWYFSRRFMMTLYERGRLSRDTMIACERNSRKELPVMLVFQESIRYLKDNLLETLRTKHSSWYAHQKPRGQETARDLVYEDDIHWVITVPVIWEDAAKQFMLREAAIYAGLQTDKLTLSLEPEAAALWCRYIPFDRRNAADGAVTVDTVAVGDSYMVVDVRDEGFDITVHEMAQDVETDAVTLRECFNANGGNLGGITVDMEFADLIDNILGPDVMEVVKQKHSDDYSELMQSFKIKMRTTKPTMNGTETVNLPMSFLDTFKEINRRELKDALGGKEEYAGKFTLSNEKLRIDAETWKNLFSRTVNNICGLARINYEDIKNIILVGGFAKSQMLQRKMEETFPDQLIIIPEDSELCVLKGAVLYGHIPAMITYRVSKHTYGIKTIRDFEPAFDRPEKRVVREDKVLYKDFVSIHARVGQKFQPGDMVGMVGEHEYVAYCDEAQTLHVDVYTSPEKYPRNVDRKGRQKIGEMRVKQQPGSKVRLKFGFGKTELTLNATAVDEQGTAMPLQDVNFEFLEK